MLKIFCLFLILLIVLVELLFYLWCICMSLISFLNPLSFEGQNLVKNSADLSSVFNRNDDLINIIMHSNHQNISHPDLPETIGDLAINRIKWYIERKNNKGYNSRDYAYLFDENIYEYDVIAFHMLAQAIASKFRPNSREVRLFVESQGFLIEDRLTKLLNTEREEVVGDVLNQLLTQNELEWSFLKELIASKKISLCDLVLQNGEIILDREEFVYSFGDNFTDRSPDRIYDILIGSSLKELILTKMIMQSTEEYIQHIHDMLATVEVHPMIEELATLLADTIDKSMAQYSSYYGNANSSFMKIGKLIREAFPPCIANTVEGVSSGGRNDAIVLLLTSFVSYARLYPGIFGSEGGVKVSDIDSNLSITNNEILPLIYEAAENCTPPLFEDQPQEKINITAKLGFGMHEFPEIDNEGETTWYTPMSCEKIQMHLPQLCKKNKDCKKINNPLSYYSRKKWILNKEGKISEESKSSESKEDNKNKDNTEDN